MRAKAPLQRELRPYLIPLCLLLLITIYNWPLITMQALALGGDGLTLFYPAEHLLARSLREGTLPFWVPELQCGFPLLADGQPGALYPPNLLAFGLLPTPFAHNLVVLLHCLIGFSLTFLWVRTLGMSHTAAGWSAFLFTLTTPLVGTNVPMLETLTWTPGLFLVAERLAQRRSLRQAPLASLIAALQWLAGFPQITFYSFLLVSLYLFLRLFNERISRKKRGYLLLGWLLSLLLGTMMGAPQLLPTYKLSLHSIRAGGIRGSMLGERSLFPFALVTYLLPSWRPFFGQAGLGFGLYLGLLPLLMATLPLRSRDRARWLFPLLGTMIAALIFSFGKFTPFFFLFRLVPGLSSFRVPSRFLLFTQLGLASLAGRGWDILNSPPISPTTVRWIRRGLVAMLILVLLNSVIGYPLLTILQPSIIRFLRTAAGRVASDPYHIQPWSYYEAKIIRLYGHLLDATSWRSPSFFFSLLILGGAILCWRICAARSRRWAWIRWIWGGLIALDLLAFAGWIRTGPPPSVVTQPPPSVRAIRLDAPPSLYRTFWVVDREAVTPDPEDLDLLPANFNALFGLSSTGLYSPLGLGNYYRLLEELSTVNLAFGLRPVAPEVVHAKRALLDLLNVRYILSRTPLEGFPLVAREGRVRIYRNPTFLPRAFVVDEVRIVSSNEEAVRQVKENAEQVRTCAILEEPPHLPLTPGSASTSAVVIESYTPMEVRIRVMASGNVLLVLTDTSYPGWEAELDGHPTPIYRANGVFRAVAVPSGTHRVTFVYHPHSFRAGLLIAAIGLAISGALAYLLRPSGSGV